MKSPVVESPEQTAVARAEFASPTQWGPRPRHNAAKGSSIALFTFFLRNNYVTITLQQPSYPMEDS